MCKECGLYETLAGGLCPRCIIVRWVAEEGKEGEHDFDADELGLDPEEEYDA